MFWFLFHNTSTFKSVNLYGMQIQAMEIKAMCLCIMLNKARLDTEKLLVIWYNGHSMVPLVNMVYCFDTYSN